MRTNYFHSDEEFVASYRQLSPDEKVKDYLSLRQTYYSMSRVSPYLKDKGVEPMDERSFRTTLEILEHVKGDYCLVGGLAVIYYGVARLTKDADFMVIASRDTMRTIHEKLTEAGFESDFRRSDLFDPVGDLIRVRHAGVYVDLMQAHTLFHQDVVKRAVDTEIFNALLKMARAEDVILLKLLAGSPIDLYDAQNIFRTLSPAELDMDYLNVKANELAVYERWAEIRK